MQVNIPHYVGHRQRFKLRITCSTKNLADYELLELILFFTIPRKDVKPLVKELLKKISNFSELLNTSKEKLLTIKGTNESLDITFLILKELINRVLKQKVINQNSISSWIILVDYLRISMGNIRFRTI